MFSVYFITLTRLINNLNNTNTIYWINTHATSICNTIQGMNLHIIRGNTITWIKTFLFTIYRRVEVQTSGNERAITEQMQQTLQKSPSYRLKGHVLRRWNEREKNWKIYRFH